MNRVLYALSVLAALAFSAPAFAVCSTAAPDGRVKTQTSYTIGQTDNCKLIVANNASPVAYSLPAPGTAGGYAAPFSFSLFDLGAGTLTLTPAAPPTGGSTPTINGLSSLTFQTGQGGTIYAGYDGNFYASGSFGNISGPATFGTITFGSGSTIGGTIAGGAASAAITATGTNGNLLLAPASGGVVGLGGTTVANSAVQVTPVTSGVDFLSATGSATGTPGSVSLYAAGTDSNVLFNLGPKGTGYLNLASSAGTPSHVVTTQTTPPALTSCGTGSPAITGSDTAGIVTMGTSATGCVITFNTAYTTAPYCIVNWIATPLASQSWATSNTAITLTQTSTSGNKAVYVCLGTTGG